MRRVRFSGRARAQLRAIALYLLQKTGDDRAGEAFIRQIDARVSKLSDLPGALGRPRPTLGEGIRSLPHHGYVIIFRYGEETIDVVQVVHSRRWLPPTGGGD